VVRNEQRRRWLEVAFALVWIGALSVYWIHIKMNVGFQALLGLGAGLDFPASLIYVSAIYTASITTILWVGLGIYLTMTGGLRVQGLLRGLLVILLVVSPSLTTGIFLTGLLLSPVVAYMTTWLPLFFASWLSMRVARRSVSVDVESVG
jgi:MFS family permease